MTWVPFSVFSGVATGGSVTIDGLGPWSSGATYSSGDFVTFGNTIWMATAATLAGESPITDPDKWRQLSGLVHVQQTSHGLTASDNGKPIGWQSAGAVAVWDDADTTEFPVGILHSYINANELLLAPAGTVIDIPAALATAPTGNNRFMYWDESDGVYETAVPGDSVVTIECIYYIAENADGTHKVLVLP